MVKAARAPRWQLTLSLTAYDPYDGISNACIYSSGEDYNGSIDLALVSNFGGYYYFSTNITLPVGSYDYYYEITDFSNASGRSYADLPASSNFTWVYYAITPIITNFSSRYSASNGNYVQASGINKSGASYYTYILSTNSDFSQILSIVTNSVVSGDSCSIAFTQLDVGPEYFAKVKYLASDYSDYGVWTNITFTHSGY